MRFVDIIGAGRLHNEPSPAVQLVYRTPEISSISIRQSTHHGLEFLHSKSAITFSNLEITSSLGVALNSLQLNVQTTDQKSSYTLLPRNTLSSPGPFSMLDVCDPHKNYFIEQRVILFYQYTNLPRDCVKVFRTRLSTTNLGSKGQIGIRFMQLMLVNNTIQNDTFEIYNGTLFQSKHLMSTLSNGSSRADLEQFYLSNTGTLSVYMKVNFL